VPALFRSSAAIPRPIAICAAVLLEKIRYSAFMDECIFCRIVGRETPAYIVDENDHVVVIITRENHPLVLTKEHIPDVYSLDDASACAVMREAVRIARAVKSVLRCDGVNLVQSNGSAAGQDVFHFHLHIKPRYDHDTVTLFWEHEHQPEETRRATMDAIKNALPS
jgi:histidine triad (HIT) family protein